MNQTLESNCNITFNRLLSLSGWYKQREHRGRCAHEVKVWNEYECN
jgi:hypothetical protein